MKKVNIFVLLLCLIILSGCEVKSTIKINDDLSANEKVNIKFANIEASNFSSVKEYVDSYLNYYLPVINYKKYKYKYNEGKEYSNVNFIKSDKDICKLINNSFFPQFLYKNINCNIDDDVITITSVGNQLLSLPSSMKRFNVQKAVIELETSIDLIDSNEDFKKNNKYIWEYDLNSDSTKNMYIKISKKKLVENYKKITRVKTMKKGLGYFFVFAFIIVSFVLLFKFLYKKYKNNKLEY